MPLPSSPSSSALLHLVHPFTLDGMHRGLNHVKRFRSYLGSLSPRGENAQIAKDELIDMVNCSGINLDALEKTISEFLGEVKAAPGKSDLINEFSSIDDMRYSGRCS